MPDMWMDVDVALSEVPVNILPLVDDTDFKTIESAVAYNAAGMALKWNFITVAGAYTQTAVTPTTAGVYDWANQGAGMYSIEIPASGGASINNDTEGFGWLSGVATGVLPWRGPTIGFRAAGLNDLLIENPYSTTRGLSGTALPAVAAEAAGGLLTRGSGAGQINQNANGQVDVRVVGMATDTVDANALKADAVTEIQSGLSTLTAAGVRTAVGLASANLDTQLATIAGYIDTEIAAILAAVDTEVAAIKAKTDNLPASPAATGDAMTLTSGERNSVADALLGRNIAGGSSTGRTVTEALRRLRNRVAIAAGTMTVYQENDSSSSWTAAVTTTAGNPVSEVDPA